MDETGDPFSTDNFLGGRLEDKWYTARHQQKSLAATQPIFDTTAACPTRNLSYD